MKQTIIKQLIDKEAELQVASIEALWESFPTSAQIRFIRSINDLTIKKKECINCIEFATDQLATLRDILANNQFSAEIISRLQVIEAKLLDYSNAFFTLLKEPD